MYLGIETNVSDTVRASLAPTLEIGMIRRACLPCSLSIPLGGQALSMQRALWAARPAGLPFIRNGTHRSRKQRKRARMHICSLNYVQYTYWKVGYVASASTTEVGCAPNTNNA